MGKDASLSYKNRHGEERSWKIDREVFRIGRLDDNDIAFENPYISRYHVEIVSDGSSFQLRDLGSTSGTFVNGERVKLRHLKDGDQIRLGRGRGLEFVFHGDPARGDEDSLSGRGGMLRPVRVITPEDTRFINTSKLPHSGNLTGETVDRLRALYEFSGELLSAQSSKNLSEKLAQFMHRTLKAERCAVLLYDRDADALEVVATSEAEKFVAPSRSITNLVYNDNVAVLSLDASTDERFSAGDSVRFQSIRSVMCAPIGSKTRVWGVCYVDNMTTERAFDDEALDFLTAVARQSGLTMENLYLLEEQRRSLESFIRTLAASLDARDDNTAGHSARVGAISSGIAKAMGLSESDCRLIYYAGLLHDYGKIGVRDDVLLKPSELTPEEYAHVKEHPQHTFRLLSKIRFPEDLADIPFVAAAHHERWDGSGYPLGLEGEEIPIGSRIVAVADAYDALTEERCYHEPWSPERAIDELTERSGTFFDPTVVEAFLQYYRNEMEPRNRLLNERKTIKQ
ncbi:MAG TPA: HD domain-containing phosphohydrolase [Blastocatellia bacterium]|jgi:HD-GYP domain-containing protein (c-di-GMP phosphodiesterase class II)|nr:HD domain-containing phosphohydrolase [Blastocatellia bacterium]